MSCRRIPSNMPIACRSCCCGKFQNIVYTDRQTNVFTMFVFVFVFVDISSILFRASWQSIFIITINITFIIIITMSLFNGSLNLYSYCVRIGLWALKAGLHTSTDNTDANVHVSTCICVKYFKLFNWQSLKATLISLSNQM